MKNENAKIENLSPIAKELVKNGKTTVLFVSKSAFPNFYTYSERMLNSFYQLYRLTEKGEDTEKVKNIAYSDLKTMLSFIGKVNGFNITTNAQIENTTLFNDVLSMCTQQKKICVSADLAHLNCEKKESSKELKQARETENSDKTLELTERIKAIRDKISDLKVKANKEIFILAKANKSAFTRNFEIRIRQIISNQLSMDYDELKQARVTANKERKAKRAKKTDK